MSTTASNLFCICISRNVIRNWFVYKRLN